MGTDPFADGQLPSVFPEAKQLPAVQRLLKEQVDMQFADLRALLRLPDEQIAPNVGCNLTTAAMIVNQISGFSIWFFHNRQAMRIRTEEKRRKRGPLSGKRFKAFVRAYYPRQVGEPTVEFIAEHLYEGRNALSHSLGIGHPRARRRRKQIGLVKPDPPLTASDVVDLERQAVFPLAGTPVRRNGLRTLLYIPGLYWALGRMLRASLSDQPARCEEQAERLLLYLPVPQSET